MIISCRATTPAPDARVVAEVCDVLERRGALEHPPLTLAVSDAVALGIAGLFSGTALGAPRTVGARVTLEF